MKIFTYITLLFSILMLAAEILDLINMDKEPLILQIVNMQTNQKLDMPTGIFIVALLITMVLSIVYFIIGIVGLQVINAKDVNSLDCMIATLKFSCGAVVVMLLCQYTLVSIYFINLRDMLIYFAWLTLMSAIQILLIVFLWINSGLLKNSLTEFHNFLVSYRQTPRSRIFKKHLPAGTMEPIMEADSFLEHSV
jgi:hypothetical protein